MIADLHQIRKAVLKNPEALNALTDDERIAIAKEIIGAEDERYARCPYEWAMEQVRTVDEASNQQLRFPDTEYIKDLFQALDESPKLAIVKSRRMFVTWAVATKLTHSIRYKPNYAGFIQASTEGKSAYIVNNRMAYIEDHIAPLYHRPYRANRTVHGLIGQMTYHQTGSYAKAIAEGASAFRAFTPSFIMMDEIEFMERGHESFVAVLPFSEKKCQIVLISTSNGPHGVLADMARASGFERFK